MASMIAFGGCDGDEDSGAGRITVAQGAKPLVLDPAAAQPAGGSQRAVGSESIWLVYTPLLTYRHAEGHDGTELVPGLAADLPEISDDGETYVLTMRDSLEYSDGKAVRASDFEHAVRRALQLGPRGPELFGEIEGVDRYLRADRPSRDISGIEADDQTGEIIIRLDRPDSSFPHVLATWSGAPVPRGTPFRDLTEDPPAGVGAYEIAEVVPGGSFVLEKTASFEELDIPDIPTGNVEAITTRLGIGARRRAEMVLDNRFDYAQGPFAADVRQALLDQAGDRYVLTPERSYGAVIGHPKVESLFSEGLDAENAVFHPLGFHDYSSLALKGDE